MSDHITIGSSPQLRWGIIGCGAIANEMAASLALEGRKLNGVANRTQEKAQSFAEKYGIARVYDSFDELYEDPDIDAVYITTTHNTHAHFICRALEAGKHVLCEKAITLNTAELDEALARAASHNLVLMDACTILHMPLYKELHRRLVAGDFGRLHLAQVNFGSFREYDSTSRFLSMDLAGGAVLDIGVYAFTLARTFLASKPTEIASFENPASTGVDEESVIIMRNAERQLATFSLTLHAKQPKRGVIATDKGYLELVEYPRADEATFVKWPSAEVEHIRAGERRFALNYALADLEAAVAGDSDSARMATITHDVMELMTQLRESWGLRYPEEIAADEA